LEHSWGKITYRENPDQRHPPNLTMKNLTLSVCKDHQGAIRNFENVRESFKINYFAQLLYHYNITAHLFINLIEKIIV
jgi:hypothetical protein